MSEVWHPTTFFGFQVNKKGEQVLCQQWISSMGVVEFRPVPMVEVSDRRPSIAGYLEEDDEDR